MQDNRSFKTDLIQRSRASADTKRKVSSWTVWETAAKEPFEIHYDRAVSFFVVNGRAEVTFTDGTVLDIQKDDFVTINPTLWGSWKVIEPVTNLYMYHDTRSSV